MAQTQRWQRDRFGWVSMVAVTLLAFYPISTAAQVAGDGTLGTQVNGSTIAPCTGNCITTDGATRGSNLFHSFRQFSLPNGDFAGFITTPAIQNVIVRVTGVGQPFISNINGTIATSNPANFFLLNPNGILFGPGAALNIGGSFLATTANRMQFSDGTEFRTDAPAPLLTISLPIGLQFGATPGNIQTQGLFLSAGATDSFSDFALVGGDVSLDNTFVRTLGQQLFLGGVGENGMVGLRLNGNDLRFSLPEPGSRADIAINRSTIDVRAEDAGSIAISSRNLDINNSGLFAGIGSGLGDVDSQANDITLNATGAIAITNSGIFNDVDPGAVGNGGNIVIKAESFVLDDSLISASTTSRGNAGKVFIQVNSSALFTGVTTVLNTVAKPAGQGSAGGITLTAGSLSLLKGAQLVANTEAQGSTSDITVDVRGAVLFDGQDSNGEPSGIFNVVRPEGQGDSGNILLKAESFTLTNGARLQTNTRGVGNAGNVNVQVRDFLYFDAVNTSDRNNFTGIFTAAGTDGKGRGGNIDITAGSLTIVNGAQLTANTFAQGDAGNIRLTVRDRALFSGFSIVGSSGAFSAVGEVKGGSTIPAFGQGGSIYIESGSLTVTNGARFGTSVTSGSRGNAGGVTIVTRNTTLFDGIGGNGAPSGVFTLVAPGAVGNANTIDITTDALIVTNGALLNATIAGQGIAGNINVQATNLEVSNGGQFFTTTAGNASAGNIALKVQDRVTLTGANSGLFANTDSGSTGNGGNIFIDPQIVTLQDGARITVDSQGAGEGGTIEIQAGKLILDNQAFISAETASNQGGNITLNVRDLLLLRRGSQISTSAGTAQAGGDGGNININSKFIVAVLAENSDITANAFTGSGGRVNITAQGIFGLKFQPQLTPLSDITASSQFGISGTVTLNLLNVDPSRGLVALPLNLTDPSQQISQSCTPGSKTSASSFVATGRGGIPLSPDEPLESRAVMTMWIPLPEANEVDAGTRGRGDGEIAQFRAQNSTFKTPTPIVESQGWIIWADGVVELVASLPTVDRANVWATAAMCQTSQGD